MNTDPTDPESFINQFHTSEYAGSADPRAAMRRELTYHFELDAFLREHGYLPPSANTDSLSEYSYKLDSSEYSDELNDTLTDKP